MLGLPLSGERIMDAIPAGSTVQSRCQLDWSSGNEAPRGLTNCSGMGVFSLPRRDKENTE